MVVDVVANSPMLMESEDQSGEYSDDSTVPRTQQKPQQPTAHTEEEGSTSTAGPVGRRQQLLRRRSSVNGGSIRAASQRIDGLTGLSSSKRHILLSNSRKQKGVLKSPTHAGGRRSNKRTHSVSFSNIYIREYARTVGDNPSVSSGPPLSISWEHTPGKTMPLEKYESARRPRRDQTRLIVPRKVRERWLLEVWGVKQSEIAKAIRANLKIQNSRRTTYHNQGKATEKVEEAMETRGWFGIGKRADKKAQELEEQQKAAAAQAAKQAKEPQAAAASVKSSYLKPEKQRPQRRLTAPHKAAEEFGDAVEEFGVPCQYVALFDLLRIQKDSMEKSRGRGILRNGPGSSTDASTVMQESKNVTFAVNASTNDGKVWCLVKEVEIVDESLHPILWWPEDDMEERYEQDMEIAALVEGQYGDLLRAAFKSTKAKTNKSAKLDFEQMGMCNIARGLEKEVMPEISDISSMHSDAVLQKQEILQSEGSSLSLDEDDWESIRQSSLKYSRPCRMIASKLAEFDRYDRNFE